MIVDISSDVSDGQHMFIITDKQSTDGNREKSDIPKKDFVSIKMICQTENKQKEGLLA